MTERRKLRAYQRDMIKYMIKNRNFGLFVEMRLGKTLTTVRRVQLFKKADRNLIVCPYSAFRAWNKELVTEGEGRPVELTGTRLQRLAKMRLPGKWFILNKEGHRVIPEVRLQKWKAVILDENFISNPKSKVSQFYCRNFRDVLMRGLLTGTPRRSSDLDYIMLGLWLDAKFWDPFKNFWEIRANLFKVKQFRWKPTKEGKEFIELSLADKVHFLTRRNVKLGGLKVYQQRYVKLPKEVMTTYKILGTQMILQIEREVKKTIYAPIKHSWMRRLFGGFYEGKRLHNAKLVELVELLEGELLHEQVVIICHFVEEVEMVAEYLREVLKHKFHVIHGSNPKKKKDREPLIDDFQAGKVRGLVGQAACFQHSTDLSKAKTMIFYSSPPGVETRGQVEARIETTFSDEPLLYIDLIAEDTIEEDILTSLMLKEGEAGLTRRIVKSLQKTTGMFPQGQGKPQVVRYGKKEKG